jgi:DNA-binding NarL/FixJ family response regulator
VIRAVIADDHQLFRQGLKELLTADGGIEVVGTASNGAEVLSVVGTLQPDLLLLDLSMPLLNGLDALLHLRRQEHSPKIVILSMHNDPVGMNRAFAMGADGYVVKEEAFDHLLLAIERVMAGQRFFPEGIGKKPEARGEEPREVLSPREREIVTLIAEGKTTKEIASALAISVKTVETHRQRTLQKLGLSKATELVRYALRQGFVKD